MYRAFETPNIWREMDRLQREMNGPLQSIYSWQRAYRARLPRNQSSGAMKMACFCTLKCPASVSKTLISTSTQ